MVVKRMACKTVIHSPRYHGNFNLVEVFATLVGPHDRTSEKGFEFDAYNLNRHGDWLIQT